MNKYVKYLWYVLKHKWYVFLECWKVGIIWRGIIHDWDKFLPSEFIPYANYFYGESSSKTRHCKQTNNGDKAFDLAWLLHQKLNKHHWQWWILPEDDGGTKILEMSPKYCKEMICDWIGASRAKGYNNNTIEWYKVNYNRMQLHRDTRIWIEKELDAFE